MCSDIRISEIHRDVENRGAAAVRLATICTGTCKHARVHTHTRVPVYVGPAYAIARTGHRPATAAAPEGGHSVLGERDSLSTGHPFVPLGSRNHTLNNLFKIFFNLIN